MTFEEILDQAIAMLQRRGRLTYGTLKRQFQLDDAALEDLKDELIYGQRLAADEDGRVLVWTGETGVSPMTTPRALQPAPLGPPPATRDVHPAQSLPLPATPPPEAERRQLTVLFCDLVDSTPLASHLDPEDLREVIRAYQATCAEVIQRFDGHIAQYLGDGLLVYFGYPQAHEDDAQRAVRTGLGMVAALQTLNTRLEAQYGLRLAVRLGIHTGVVVVGAMGGRGRQEHLALGETPNIAARLQALAAPDTVVISAATFRLVQGYFTAEALGTHTLRGVAAPVPVYRMVAESGVQSRLDTVTPTRLTPLVGRDEEVALVHRRWDQATRGTGQAVLISGEAGIGKSRLVQVLKDYAAAEPHTRLEWRGSPYHQQSALYPVIDHLHRLLRGHPDDLPPERLRTLEATLASSGVALAEAVPLLAGLLSLPLPAAYPPLTLTPQRQRQKTLETLLGWLHAEAQRQPVLCVVEDLHWVDPSTLELLSVLMDQSAQRRFCLVLTARPEFHPPWAMAAHLTVLTLRRFAPAEVERVVRHMASEKAFPSAVLQEVVRKTDGVPLFVEELTKTVLESGLLEEQEDSYTLPGPLPPIAIPATLHDSLMARLDRLATVKAMAQLGATLGREFAYILLQAVSPWDEATLRRGLQQLVQAELLYQQGLPPQATYLFKHALIQDAAYQSLLKSTRQRYHQQIAQVLETQFSETAETQPELLAHHYTEAGLGEAAVGYWQRAGRRALERSANLEAVSHLTKGLEVLKTLPDAPQRLQQELDLQTTLGPALMATRGNAAPEVGRAYARARELCQQVGEAPELFPVLFGLWRFYYVGGELQAAREVGEQLLGLAQRQRDLALLLEAHRALGGTLHHLGEFAPARVHLGQGVALYDPQQHRTHAFEYGRDPGTDCHAYLAWTLWPLGYPDQAAVAMQQTLTLAEGGSHPFSLATALFFAAWLYQYRREIQVVQAHAEAAIAVAAEQRFPQWLAGGIVLRGWVLVAQGQAMEGIEQLRQGIAAWWATGAKGTRPYFLGLLAEAYGKVGQGEAGLTVLAQALAIAHHSGERYYEAQLHRLKGELLLALPGEQDAEAEACFQQALEVARRQEAKSLELRAAMSLSRLWQQQGKRQEAHDLLAPVYHWFTEGFDTADLQDAKVLLEALGEQRHDL